MNNKNLKLAILLSCLFATKGFAQVKVGDAPTTINANSVLEIESTNKGLLLPRIALTATNAAAPLTAHVAGMTVYNTATAGTSPNDVTPGYYYNNGTAWIRTQTEKPCGIISDVAVGTTININGEYLARLTSTSTFDLGVTAIGTAKNSRWATADNSAAGAGSTIGTASVAVGTYQRISNDNWTAGQRANAWLINLDNNNIYEINAVYYGSSLCTIWWKKIN